MIRDVDGLISKIGNVLRERMDYAVVGMSGGADSTLVTILCQTALGADRVYSVHMPAVPTDHQTFNKRSLMTADRLGVHRLIVPIHDPVAALTGSLSQTLGATLSPTNAGNARARLRMAILYGVCCHVSETRSGRCRVVGTGNLSEDFIGYDTKGGDALADIFIIGELFKSEVYQLLEHFRDTGLITEAMIDRVPSAGLWEGQTDESELGFSYNAMETSIRRALNGGVNSSEIDQFVWNRHLAHKHKHEAPFVVGLREFCD